MLLCKVKIKQKNFNVNNSLIKNNPVESFNFVVMTNSRVKSTVKILGQLLAFNIYGNIILSDSGGRGIGVFKKEAAKINAELEDILYVDNSKHKLDSIQHFYSILKLDYKNTFIFHDDDEIIEGEFLNVLEHLSANYIECFCSTKTMGNQFLSNFSALAQRHKVDVILKMYFLSYDGNCPLFTGFYTKNPSQLLSNIDSQHLISGKYADVALMSWFLSQNNSEISSVPYMNYIEHDDNGNNIRCLDSRIALSNFVRNRGGMSNKILSLLIYRNYSDKTLYYFLGVMLALVWPVLWMSLLRKLIFKIKRMLNQVFSSSVI